MTTIVLFGVRGSGKDTVGDLLVANHWYIKEAFANPIKQMVKLAFPKLTDEDLWGPSEKRERQEPGYPMGDRCLRCDGRLLVIDMQDDDTWTTTRCEGCRAYYPRFVNARIACQMLGTEWGRRLYRNVWVDSAFDRIDRYHKAVDQKETRPFVITDGRFLNELERSRALGAYCVKLTRGLPESIESHQSEAEFREIPDSAFDYVLDNVRIPLDQMVYAVRKMLAYATAPHHVQE